MSLLLSSDSVRVCEGVVLELPIRQDKNWITKNLVISGDSSDKMKSEHLALDEGEALRCSTFTTNFILQGSDFLLVIERVMIRSPDLSHLAITASGSLMEVGLHIPP